VSSISESPLACEPLPPGSLSGQIALIERGVCMFSIKVFHAQEAGASAAIIYNNEDGGDTVIVMAPGERSNEINIPSVFVGYSTGAGMTDWYATHGTAAQVQIDPQARIIEQTPDVVIGFSSRGPTFQHTLKPDLLAPGFNILSAGFDPLATGLKQHTGFGVSSGTSMAAPHVAGAAALLKQAHPDWSSNDIKSALMSTHYRNLAGPGPHRGGRHPGARRGAH
jgi:subtilisin family serine protease